jgi:hypothetical protein
MCLFLNMNVFSQSYSRDYIVSDNFPCPGNDKCMKDENGVYRVKCKDGVLHMYDYLPYPMGLERNDDCYVILLFRNNDIGGMDFLIRDTLKYACSKFQHPAYHVETFLFCGGDLSQNLEMCDNILTYGCYMNETYGEHICDINILFYYRAFALKISKAEMLYLFLMKTYMSKLKIPYNMKGIMNCVFSSSSRYITDYDSIFDLDSRKGTFCSQCVILTLRECLFNRRLEVSSMNSCTSTPCDILKVVIEGKQSPWQEVAVKSLFTSILKSIEGEFLK